LVSPEKGGEGISEFRNAIQPPAIPTESDKPTNKMKFIIAATTQQTELTSLLRSKGHLVLGITHDLDELPHLILTHSPHGIYVCGAADEKFVKNAIEVTTRAPDQIVLLRSHDDESDVFEKQILALEKILRLGLRRPCQRPDNLV
jgi:hypothetical protein